MGFMFFVEADQPVVEPNPDVKQQRVEVGGQ